MKWIAVLAVAGCALVGSLYATAAPEKRGPTNAALAAQVASLRTQVKVLKADIGILKSDLDWVAGGVKGVGNCLESNLVALWRYEQSTFGFVVSLYGDSQPPLEHVRLFAPKRPECA